MANMVTRSFTISNVNFMRHFEQDGKILHEPGQHDFDKPMDEEAAKVALASVYPGQIITQVTVKTETYVLGMPMNQFISLAVPVERNKKSKENAEVNINE